MPTYHYRCECGHEFEIYQSIKDARLKHCDSCNQDKLETVLYGGIGGFVDPGVTTIGKQAEVNSAKMGKYKISELDELNKKDPKDGFTFTTKEQRKILNKKNPEQIQRYVLEGK